MPRTRKGSAKPDNGDKRPQPPRLGNPDADPVKIHREYVERRLGGGRQAAPEAYERANAQWRRLPGGISRPPATATAKEDEPRGSSDGGDDQTPEEEWRRRQEAAAMTLVGTVWTPIGPSPIPQGGRQDNGLTTAIAVNPNNGNIIYQGTAGGGVWRTLDGGSTWTPIFDRQVALGIGEPGAIAIDPTDTRAR